MRSKWEVIQHYYGASTINDADNVLHQWYLNKINTQPPLDQWVTMKFPYEAPVHPPLPSVEEIFEAFQNGNQLSHKLARNRVSKVGECAIKYGTYKSLLQVRKHSITPKVAKPRLF